MVLALLMLRERLRVPRHVGLRLASAVRRIGGTAHRLLPIVTVVEATLARRRCFVLRAGEVGIVLAELLLRRGYDAVIVLGVLIVVLRPDYVAGLGLSPGERQIPLIVSLRVLRALRLGAGGTRCPPLRACSK